MILDFIKKFFAIDPVEPKKSLSKPRKPVKKKKTVKPRRKPAAKKKSLKIKKTGKVSRRKVSGKKISAKNKVSSGKKVRPAAKKNKTSSSGAVLRKKSKKRRKITEKEIGVITHYFSNISVGIIKLKRSLKVNEAIHVKGAHTDFIQLVASMQIDREDVSRAGPGAEVGIKVVEKVHRNDRVYIAG
jgi:hypothetical protein